MSRYEVALSLRDMFTPAAQRFERESENITRSLGETRRALSNLRSESAALNQFERLSERSLVTASRVSQARAEVDHFSTALRESGGASRDAALGLARAQSSLQRLSLTRNRELNQLDGLRQRLSASGHNLDDISAAQRQLASSIELTNSALGTQRDRFRDVSESGDLMERRRAGRKEILESVRSNAMRVGALAAPSAYFAVDFETAFTDVKKSARGASESDLAILKNRILSDSGALGMTPSQLASMVADIGKNNVSKDKLFDYAEFSAQMATAFDMKDSQNAVDSAMRWRSGMGLDFEGLKKLGDTINHVADSMSTTPMRLSEIITRQGSTLKSAGFSPSEIAALAGAIDSASPNAEMSATALKNLSLALAKGDSATGAQKAVLDRLGYDPKQLAADMQRDATGTVVEVFKSFKTLKDDERTSAVNDFFGSESIGAITPLLENIGNLERSFSLLNDNELSGSMGREFEQKIETAAFKIDELKSSMQALAVTAGDQLLPAIKSVLGGASSLFQGLQSLSSESKTVAGSLVGIPLALAAIGTGWKALSVLRRNRAATESRARERETRSSNRLAVSATRAAQRVGVLSSALDGLDGGSGRRGRRRNRGSRRGSSRMSRLSALGARSSEFVGRWGSRGARALGRVAVPLAVAASASDLIGVASRGGSALELSEATGGFVGGLGGAVAGGAAGAAAGSIIPVVGTAIGGLLGSILGGLGGEFGGGWIGEQVGHLFDADAEQKKSEIKNKSSNVTFSPTINVQSSGDAERDAIMLRDVESMMEEQKNDFMDRFNYRFGDA